MKRLCSLLLALGLWLLSSIAYSSGMRCGTSVIHLWRDTPASVMKKCGTPDSEHQLGYLYDSRFTGVWMYDLKSKNGMVYSIYFEYGHVSHIVPQRYY